MTSIKANNHHSISRSTLAVKLPVKLPVTLLAALSIVISTAASGQTSVGAARGTVASSLGDSIRIENRSVGYSREIPIDASGRYDINALPAGDYDISLLKNASVISTQTIRVSPGITVSLDFTAASVAVTQLQGVNVKGTGLSVIDVSKSETSTVFTARELQEIPVNRNQVSVALLTPGSAPGTLAFGELPSFGGATVAENAYYLNGFDVTNLFDNLSFSPAPFEAIGAEQVLTGGYGPEYNRSTGGVLSITTKRGSNQFDMGASAYWQPNSLRGREPDVYFGTTNTQTTPLLYQSFDRRRVDQTEANVWVSGPAIKDRLFYYLLFQKTWLGTDTDGRGRDTAPGAATATAYTSNHDRRPFYLAKVDGYLNESNHLELTYLNDHQRSNGYSYNETYLGPPGDATALGAYKGNGQSVTGGNLYVGTFTSTITDRLTSTVQWGQLLYKVNSVVIAPDGSKEIYNGVLGDTNQPGCPFVSDAVGVGPSGSFVSSSCTTGGSINTEGTRNTRTNYRGAIEYKLDFGRLGAFNYGAHRLSLGYEHDNFNSSGAGQSLEGGRSYAYDQRAADDAYYPGQTYVTETIFQTNASARVTEQSFYLKDDWQFLDRVVLNLGLRDDSFNNRNASGNAGQTYVKQDNIIQPRLGLAWDIKGDASMKAFANYGQYSLPIVSSVAVRGAAASLFKTTTYYFSGVDPTTGIPQGLTPTPSSEKDPAGIYHGEGYYVNGETGLPPNPNSVSDNTLKPIKQSEYILGLQAALYNDWVGTVRAIHRNLDNTIDDDCDGRPIQAAAARQYGIIIGNGSSDGSGSLPTGVAGCYIVNPGRGAVLQEPIDVNNPGQLYTLNLSAADLNLPKAKRVYDALEVTADKRWGHRWFFHGSYTWAHSYGNTEGLVKSSIAQANTGTTEDFDYPELMENSYGNQANDHRHTLKTFGAYKPIDDVTVGTNFLLQSGGPYSCYGAYPGNDPYSYGNVFHYCGGKPAAQGAAGYTDTITQVDLNVLYSPHQIRGLQLSLFINNVFDEHGVESVYQFGESAGGSPFSGPDSGQSNRYGTPFAFGGPPYQTPRYLRLGARYEFKM